MTSIHPALRRLGLSLAAPLLALVVAIVVTSLVLLAVGDPVGDVWGTMFSVPKPRVLSSIVNNAIVYYIAAIAVAIGFRMNLFNIGVEGQYRVATFVAALVAGQAFLPGILNVVLAILVAMLAGGLWAAVPALLKVYKGVSEVIATIMLNAIALGVVAYGLKRFGQREAGSNTRTTTTIPESSQLDGLQLIPGSPRPVYTLVVLAVLAGLAYWFVLGRTRVGFDLRATGQSETAAVASGVKVRRTVVGAMVASGAVAGLIGMPALFGADHAYGDNFQAGLGFLGIGIALLGRNHPVGIAFAALLWSYLDKQSDSLQVKDISPEIVGITTAVILLAVVIAYEIVRRLERRLEQADVARQLPDQPAPTNAGATA